jgi:hypothetical protein
MKKYPIFVVVIMMILLCSPFIPKSEATDLVTGNSPSFSPGSSFSMALEGVETGELIQWSYSTTDSLSLYISSSSGIVYSPSRTYGILSASESGTWTWVWTNNNWMFSATVNYGMKSFAWEPTVISPTSGTTIHTKELEIKGTCHPDSTGMLYSFDNITYYPITDRRDANWALALPLNEGTNTIYINYGFLYGDSIEGYLILTYKVNTFWLYDNGTLGLGNGSFILIGLSVLIGIITMIFFIIKKRKNKNTIVSQNQPNDTSQSQCPQTSGYQYPPPPPQNP